MKRAVRSRTAGRSLLAQCGCAPSVRSAASCSWRRDDLGAPRGRDLPSRSRGALVADDSRAAPCVCNQSVPGPLLAACRWLPPVHVRLGVVLPPPVQVHSKAQCVAPPQFLPVRRVEVDGRVRPRRCHLCGRAQIQAGVDQGSDPLAAEVVADRLDRPLAVLPSRVRRCLARVPREPGRVEGQASTDPSQVSAAGMTEYRE